VYLLVEDVNGGNHTARGGIDARRKERNCFARMRQARVDAPGAVTLEFPYAANYSIMKNLTVRVQDIAKSFISKKA
jgi:hypothetical protein